MDNLPDKNNGYIDYIEKCLNCDEYSYYNWVCKNCGIWKGSEYLEQLKLEDFNENSSRKQKKETSRKLKENFENKPIHKKLKIIYKNYESYKIFSLNWKIIELHFKLNEKNWKVKKFRIVIDYDLIQKEIKETIFHETEKKERNRLYNINKIWKIYINKILQEKAKVWYKEKKHINYYSKFMNINEQDILNFTKEVIKKYHNIY